MYSAAVFSFHSRCLCSPTIRLKRSLMLWTPVKYTILLSLDSIIKCSSTFGGLPTHLLSFCFLLVIMPTCFCLLDGCVDHIVTGIKGWILKFQRLVVQYALHTVPWSFWCLHCNLDIVRLRERGLFYLLSGISCDFLVVWVLPAFHLLLPPVCACSHWALEKWIPPCMEPRLVFLADHWGLCSLGFYEYWDFQSNFLSLSEWLLIFVKTAGIRKLSTEIKSPFGHNKNFTFSKIVFGHKFSNFHL